MLVGQPICPSLCRELLEIFKKFLFYYVVGREFHQVVVDRFKNVLSQDETVVPDEGSLFVAVWPDHWLIYHVLVIDELFQSVEIALVRQMVELGAEDAG